MRFFKEHIVLGWLVFLVSCKESEGTKPQIELKDSYYFPFGSRVDNNDLQCNYYFTEDIQDFANFMGRKLNSNHHTIDELKTFATSRSNVKILENSKYKSRIENIVHNLKKANPEIAEFDVYITDCPGYYNAWMLLGDIFITESFIEKLSEDDQIAMILAHEFGHAVNHLEPQKNQVSAWIDYENDHSFSDKFSLMVDHIFGFSGKGDENEADIGGLVIMTKAGYDPLKGVEIFRHEGFYREIPPTFLSRVKDELGTTHPYSSDRFECISGKIEKYGIFKNNFHPIDQKDGTIVANDVTVYAYPSEYSDVLNQLKKEYEVPIIYTYEHSNESYNKDEKWCYIENENIKGWVKDRYIKY